MWGGSVGRFAKIVRKKKGGSGIEHGDVSLVIEKKGEQEGGKGGLGKGYLNRTLLWERA